MGIRSARCSRGTHVGDLIGAQEITQEAKVRELANYPGESEYIVEELLYGR